MSSSPIGVAILGTGFGLKVHIPGIQEHHRTRPVAVYHRRLDRAQTITEEYGVGKACDDLDALLALPEVDAVTIATPPFLHYEMAKAALKAGKHILLEKPTTLTLNEAEVLQELALERNLVTALDFEYRFVPAWQFVAELLAQSYVGKPYLIKIDWIMSSRADGGRPWNWYSRADQGGGALGALGSHSFDYINWLFGPVKQLSAMLSTAIEERFDPQSGNLQPVTADDNCLIQLELESGTPVQLTLSSVARNGRGHFVEIYGETGTLILGSSNQQDYVHGFKLWGAKSGQPLALMEIPQRLEFPQTYSDGRLAPFLRVVDNWVTSIDLGQSLQPSLVEGVYSQRLMDAAQRSNASRRWVMI
jgi:predicted dehydrogenase